MRIIFLIILVVLTGCSPTSADPSSVMTTSDSVVGLQKRIAFIEKYVTFRRQYRELEYVVDYHNNSGGMVPGPSDWDIRLIAVVPPETVSDWIPSKATRTIPDSIQWVGQTAKNIQTSGITEWYTIGNSVALGIDRKSSIIAYRNSTDGLD